MTDKDALLQICKSLGLKLLENPRLSRAPLDDEFVIMERPDGAINITLGCGKSLGCSGYVGFRAEFGFDAAGKAVEHFVYE
jgi:hypothetical protein